MELYNFCDFFQVQMGANVWSSHFLVEFAMKFGVLLAVLMSEARRNPIKPASCSILTCAFEKGYGQFDFFEVISTLQHPPFI